jgi:hypothetical protein
VPSMADNAREGRSAMPGRRSQFYSVDYACPTANALDREDYSILLELVNDVAPDWSVEVYTDPMGEVSFMIIPPDVDDAIGPTLIIYKAASVFHLDQFRWDEYGSLGDYLNLDDVFDAVRDALLSQPTIVGISTTLH